jgi:hypothetical protein
MQPLCLSSSKLMESITRWRLSLTDPDSCSLRSTSELPMATFPNSNWKVALSPPRSSNGPERIPEPGSPSSSPNRTKSSSPTAESTLIRLWLWRLDLSTSQSSLRVCPSSRRTEDRTTSSCMLLTTKRDSTGTTTTGGTTPTQT